MKILITGGAGFIGSHLGDYLLNENHKVDAVDNLSLGVKSNIAHLFRNKDFNFYREDILNYKKMAGIFKRGEYDAIFHFAANSDIAKGSNDPDVDFKNTFMTTYNILKLMKQYAVRQIIFPSSSAVYGETINTLSENYGPLLPISNYGSAKLSAEAFISSFVENYNLRAWIVRFPNVVGERATHGVVYDFISKLREDSKKLYILGDGEQYKPYLYVEDLIEAVLFIWKNSKEQINLYNIGVESKTKVKDIAKMVIEEMGLKPIIEYSGGKRGWRGDIPEFTYDLSKLNSLGWKAKISSDEAVRKSIKHILKKDKADLLL